MVGANALLEIPPGTRRCWPEPASRRSLTREIVTP